MTQEKSSKNSANRILVAYEEFLTPLPLFPYFCSLLNFKKNRTWLNKLKEKRCR